MRSEHERIIVRNEARCVLSAGLVLMVERREFGIDRERVGTFERVWKWNR